jgi:hypothetical protein
MLVTTAVDPPRRPTSDPRSQLTIGTGCSLRRAPDDGTSDGTLSWYELTCAGGRLARAFPPSGPDAIGQSGCPTGDYVTWRVQRAGAGLPDRPNG